MITPMRIFPLGLAVRFSLVLFIALVGVNMVGAYLLARQGTVFDQSVRVQADMGRLVALIFTLEEVESKTGKTVLERSSTGFTRLSLDPEPLGEPKLTTAPEIERVIAKALPDHPIRVIDGTQQNSNVGNPFLLLISVQLRVGAFEDMWVNALIYPLPAIKAWRWKTEFFLPLAITFVVMLLVGFFFIQRLTRPLENLAAAARSAGRGDRSVRVQETGARELRDTAMAFNDMQHRIKEYDHEHTRVLAAIGHDLRTPITSLRIRAELIEDDDVKRPIVRILGEMRVMTDEFFNYARTMNHVEKKERTDIIQILAAICADRGIAFGLTQPSHIDVRPVSMTRAISNLVDNALRYAGSAQVHVHIAENNDEMVIRIEDDGPGIAPDQIEMVAGLFVRGESSRNSETGGFGLGLSIAKDIIIGHNGSLSLSNRASGGLCAEVRLPIFYSDGNSPSKYNGEVS